MPFFRFGDTVAGRNTGNWGRDQADKRLILYLKQFSSLILGYIPSEVCCTDTQCSIGHQTNEFINVLLHS
jgi:hypothetical protein